MQGGDAGDQEGARGEVHENVGKQKGKVMDAQEELEVVDEDSESQSYKNPYLEFRTMFGSLADASVLTGSGHKL